jgi:hypothetical protein
MCLLRLWWVIEELMPDGLRERVAGCYAPAGSLRRIARRGIPHGPDLGNHPRIQSTSSNRRPHASAVRKPTNAPSKTAGAMCSANASCSAHTCSMVATPKALPPGTG